MEQHRKKRLPSLNHFSHPLLKPTDIHLRKDIMLTKYSEIEIDSRLHQTNNKIVRKKKEKKY